ncbi:hypothetical protein KSP40_PGU019938 [Platanthera guangdongensis]|uniref:Uncharacterized protein n=1 Tax=Platanthera guangdongensis TaxID=2320717 RepID=A0ABR2M6M7_9ASPA
MASNISIDFQSINFPCSASSSTSASTSSVLSHGRAIDRHSTHLIDPLREKYSARFHSRSKPCEKKSKNVEEKSPQPVSPATSCRYLLQDDISAIDHYFSDAESFPSLRFECLKEEDFCVVNSPSPPRNTDQLHCGNQMPAVSSRRVSSRRASVLISSFPLQLDQPPRLLPQSNEA